ncbi:MAG: amidohydrolase family protein, partial [Candidatus Heimdallarchaeota archaeon]|nr:amidohydrolase family protein [Candidatus Heimdallarchaeota archaeon]
SLEEAIRCFTVYPAIVSKDEKDKGTLEKGKLADITILDRNLDEIGLEKFHNVDVDYTIIGGKIIYKRE